MTKKDVLLQEIRQVRRRLDRDMSTDPDTVRRLARQIEKQYGVKPVKVRRPLAARRARSRKAAA